MNIILTLPLAKVMHIISGRKKKQTKTNCFVFHNRCVQLGLCCACSVIAVVLCCTHHLFYTYYCCTMFYNEIQINGKFLQMFFLHCAFGSSSDKSQPAMCFSLTVLQQIHILKNLSELFKLILHSE